MTATNSKPRRADYRLFTPVPTRWGDADALGHINNVIFVRYLECGRVDYFQQLCGLTLGPSDHQGFVLANLEIGFRSQLHHPAMLEVATRISRLGQSSFDIEASIFQQHHDDAIITSKAVCVWFDFDNNTSLALPDDIRCNIIDFEQGTLS